MQAKTHQLWSCLWARLYFNKFWSIAKSCPIIETLHYFSRKLNIILTCNSLSPNFMHNEWKNSYKFYVLIIRVARVLKILKCPWSCAIIRERLWLVWWQKTFTYLNVDIHFKLLLFLLRLLLQPKRLWIVYSRENCFLSATRHFRFIWYSLMFERVK